LTQEQLSLVYDTTQQNISQHILSVYADKELSEESTHKKFLLVRKEGTRNVNRNIVNFDLYYGETACRKKPYNDVE